MKKFLIGFLVAILLITLLIIGFLFYVGVIPGYAKQVDLGAKADPNFIISFDNAHGMKNEIPGGIVPLERQAEFRGQTELNADLSGNDVTSILTSWKKRSPHLPVRNVQIRFNKDGTGEASGILETGTAINIAKLLGYSDKDIEKGKSYVRFVAGDLPFYVKGIGGITNNLVSINATQFKLGNIVVPQDVTQKVAPVVSEAIERRINQVGGINIRTLDFSTGMLHIEGTVPDTVK